MALDGIYLSKLKKEIEYYALNSRIDKVNMPAKDSIILSLRGKNGSKKLLFSARANCMGVYFIDEAPENPPVPPMLCMLLRKHLTGAVIREIKQRELDRILFFCLDGVNEIGDRVKLTICFEIMGTYCNFILLDGEDKIIDSVKRIDFASSSVRQILPGLRYIMPEKQDKLCMLSAASREIVEKILCQTSSASKAVLNTVQGISPVISRETAYRAFGDDKHISCLDEKDIASLENVIGDISEYPEKPGKGYIVYSPDGKPVDISFMPVLQYGKDYTVKETQTLSLAAELFYSERDRENRLHRRGQELYKTVSGLIERTAKKINLQTEELKSCADRDTYRIYGEIINANLYRLEKGAFFYDLENFYDDNKPVRIPADPFNSPIKNAQKYFKLYRKAQKAEEMLTELIEKSESELYYLESVLDELTRCESEAEAVHIRQELSDTGFLRKKSGGGKKNPKALPPYEFVTSDGFTVLTGRNNLQNDRLSMKTAGKHDMFLHIQKQPGSHTIILSGNRDISDTAIEEAAVIAAYYSSGRESPVVTVDYTEVKNLKKPTGAKPGFVIYNEYYSVNVKPDREKAEKMRVK